jgi:hypothetical protein
MLETPSGFRGEIKKSYLTKSQGKKKAVKNCG